MRKLILTVALACLGISVPAQEVAKADLFGGYSFLHSGEEDLHGWNAALAYNLGRRIGVVVDGSGHYGSSAGVDLTHYLVTGGPRLSAFRGGSAAVFVHALVGLARSSGAVKIFDVSLSETDQGFAMLFGGGVDIEAGGSWALRLQGEYERVRVEGDGEGGYRLGAGVVYRIGRK